MAPSVCGAGLTKMSRFDVPPKDTISNVAPSFTPTLPLSCSVNLCPTSSPAATGSPAVQLNFEVALTDQRVIILSGIFTRKFFSFDLQRLPKLELSEHRDGTGTLAFEGGGFSFFYPGRYGGMDWWLPSMGGSQFYRIENPRRVYELIRDNAARS